MAAMPSWLTRLPPILDAPEADQQQLEDHLTILEQLHRSQQRTSEPAE